MKLQTQTPLTTLWDQPQVKKKKKGLKASEEYLPPDHGMGWRSCIIL